MTLIVVPMKEARRRFTGAGLSLLLAASPSADPLEVPIEVYEQCQRECRRTLPIPEGYDPEQHRYDGRCCS